MIAIDQRGSAGAGANMMASSLSGSEVRCSGGTVGVPAAVGTGSMGGQIEQKMFRLRISSTSLV